MKKIYCFISVALLVFGLTFGCVSCNQDVNFGIEYSLQSNGTANGDLAVTFDGGSFTLDGKADYTFSWQNTILLMKSVDAISLEQALCAKDARTVEAAKKVNDWLVNSIQVTSLGGTYDIYIKGYVRETATGLTFAIDRHFTNPETPAEKLYK